MDVEFLLKKIRDEGVFPVQVEITYNQDSDLKVMGSLDDYISAVMALKSPIIFIGKFELNEDDFFYQDGDDEEYDFSEKSEKIDLRKIEPELCSYNAHIDEVGWFQLAAPMSNGSLTFSIEEEWWTKFFEILNEAKESVKEGRSVARQKLEAEEEKRKTAAFKKVQSLISDVDFQKLKTQKGNA